MLFLIFSIFIAYYWAYQTIVEEIAFVFALSYE